MAEIPYAWAVRLRNRSYDLGVAKTFQVDVPVICVGNLTLGGTGKTPMVEWIARWYRARGIRVAMVSRGYGASFGDGNDEAMELAEKLPDVPHVQNPDRVAAARVAIKEHDCQLIVLDDAFQHRRIGRDLDIVLLDALEPFGHGHVFPRGTLREPVSGLRRAAVVALSRADMLKPSERAAIWRVVEGHAPEAVCIEIAHVPQMLLAAGGRKAPLDTLANRRVAAFCAIGNPAGFRHTLQTCGHQVAAFREFPDHHAFGAADLESLAAWADQLEVAAVVCTHKDLVKLSVEHLGRNPLWAVRVGMEVLGGQEALEARLAALLPR